MSERTHYDGLPDALEGRCEPGRFLSMHLEVKPLVVIGPIPGAPSVASARVSGGSFEGERLSGQVMDGGSDWQAVRADGSTTLDVRLVLKTKDDALVAMTYRGVRHGSADVIKRMEKGEAIDPSSYYFRINPMFETAAATYDWLNRVLAVGIGYRLSNGPIYSVFELL